MMDAPPSVRWRFKDLLIIILALVAISLVGLISGQLMPQAAPTPVSPMDATLEAYSRAHPEKPRRSQSDSGYDDEGNYFDDLVCPHDGC
jgi:hypothetical protein